MSLPFCLFFFLYYRGVLAYEQGEFKQAIAFFSQAISLFPDNYMLYSFRSAAETDNLAFSAAHRDANKVIELQPNKAEGYLRLGNVLVAADDFAKAKEAYLTALKLEPSHGLTLVALRDMDRARKVSQLKRNVQSARQAFNAGRYAESAVAFSESITLNPANPIYLVLRSLAYMADNDPRADEDAGRIAHVDSLYPLSSPILQGVLQKRGSGPVSGWKSRFFVLKERFLWYYKGQKDIFPIDVILLHHFKCVKHPKSPVRFTIELESGRRAHQLKCNSKEERETWVDLLQAIAAQPITLPMDSRENLVYFHDEDDASRPVNGKLLLVGLTHSGFLWKAGRINTAPKLRWFVLKDHVLYYFRKQETTQEAQYYGSIKLHGAQLNVATPLDFSLILPGRIWNLRADAAEEASRWIQVLTSETLGDVAKLNLSAPDAEEEKVAKLKSTFRATLAAKDFALLQKKGPGASLIHDLPGDDDDDGGDDLSDSGHLENNNNNNNTAGYDSGDGRVSVVVAAPKIVVNGETAGGFGDLVSRGGVPTTTGSARSSNRDTGSPPWKQAALAENLLSTSRGGSVNATPAASYGSSVTSEQRYFARLGLSVPDSDQSEDELAHGVRSAARSATATDDESNQSSFSDYTESAKLLSVHQAKQKAEKEARKKKKSSGAPQASNRDNPEDSDDGGCCC